MTYRIPTLGPRVYKHDLLPSLVPQMNSAGLPSDSPAYELRAGRAQPYQRSLLAASQPGFEASAEARAAGEISVSLEPCFKI